MRYHQFLNGSVEETRSGFLLAEADDGVCECFEEGCSGWDMALTCLSTLFTISLPVLFTMCCIGSALAGYYKGRARKEEQQLLTV